MAREEQPTKKPVEQEKKPVTPPKVQLESTHTLNAGQASSQHQSLRQELLKINCEKGLHVGPCGVLQQIRKAFKSDNKENELKLATEQDEEGRWTKTLKKFSVVKYPTLQVPQGAQVLFVAEGPDRQAMMDTIIVAVRNNFQKKGVGYVDGYRDKDNESGRWFSEILGQAKETLQEDKGHKTFQDDYTRDIRSDPSIQMEEREGRAIYGECAHSGRAVYADMALLSEPDYLSNISAVSPQAREFEALRLKRLLQAIKERKAAVNVHSHELEDTRSVSELLEFEKPYYTRVIEQAMERKYVSGRRIRNLNLPLDVGNERIIPNAELAICLEAGVNEIKNPETRTQMDGFQRVMLEHLAIGMNTQHASSFILDKLCGPSENPVKFKRAGIFLLSGNHLTSESEWTENGFRQITEKAVIMLDKEGDGTSYCARLAIEKHKKQKEEGNTKYEPTTYLVDDATVDPQTSNAEVIHYKNVGWSSINSPDGEVLGVIWVDNMDEKPINEDHLRCQGGLGEISRLAGELFSRVKIQRLDIPRQEKPTIAAVKKDPTYMQILEMMRKNYVGVASDEGTSKCHGVIFAGGAQFPVIVGLGPEFLHEVAGGSLTKGLLVDPVEGVGALVKEPDAKRTLPHFSIIKEGEKSSLEPPVGDIRDAVTTDGHKIRLKGTFDGITDATMNRSSKYGVEGSGLVRSEVLDIQYPVVYSLTEKNPELCRFRAGSEHNLRQAEHLLNAVDLDVGDLKSVDIREMGGREVVQMDCTKQPVYLVPKDDKAEIYVSNIAPQMKLDLELGLYREETDGNSMVITAADPYQIYEEHLYQRYRRLHKHLYTQSPHMYRDKPNVIRLQDVTPEKYCRLFWDSFGPPHKDEMGGVRFLSAHPEVARANMRAICRNADISAQPMIYMIPEANNLEDVEKITSRFNQIKSQVSPESRIRCYAQIETRQGIENIPEIRESGKVDGFALGTNDITVSVTGKERSIASPNEFSKGVIQAVNTAIERTRGVHNLVCGALTQSKEGVFLLAGMGVGAISARPESLPAYREIINSVSRQDAQECLKEIIHGPERPPEEIKKLVSERLEESMGK